MILSGNCPSSKNSRRVVPYKKIVYDKATGKKFERTVPMVLKSEYCMKWERIAKIELKNWLQKHSEDIKAFKESMNYPIFVLFYYYRKDVRQFDYNNMTQEIQDLLVGHGVFADDSCDYMIPISCGYELDRDNPRTEVVFVNRNDSNTPIAVPDNWAKTRISFIHPLGFTKTE